MAHAAHSQYLFSWSAALAFIVVGILFLTPLLITRLLRPSRPNPNKLATYECGEVPFGDSWTRFNARFYIVALVFVLFDVEIVFMYPWAVVFGSLKPVQMPAVAARAREAAPAGAVATPAPGQTGQTALEAGVEPELGRAMREGLDVRYAFAEMVIFVVILLVGFAYLWRYGFLDWFRSVRGG